MAKLYPPYIEGTIPAFYGTTLVVPFSMNQAVGATEVKNIVLKIKKVNSNEVIFTKYAQYFDVYGNCKATFNLTANEQELFNIGQFYRIQLAFVDINNTIGYFSSVGVIKYTAIPHIELVGMNGETSNLHMYDYVAAYRQELDPTEKLYSSRLQLFDFKGNIIKDTGERVHSVINDTLPNEALEYFSLNQDLELDQTYRLLLTMTTINGITVTSPKYRVIQRENTNLKFDETRNLIVRAKSDYDSGASIIRLESIYPDKEVMSGTFILSRSEAVRPYDWKKIQKFIIKSGKIAEIKFMDYTVEQGKNYIYSIQQYNNYGIYSTRIVSNKIYTDFEDTFLLDGERQLKIRFNSKVSSMKDNIVETKVNTIGSKYPFITRNGRVNHKEFSLSGLVSYQMDDDRVFMDWKKLGISQNITNLTSDNVYAERIFKLEVLAWLNNGKPKILKSPTEGNYIVRIMGVSMSPNEAIGRMLHTFNCTATEIAPFDYSSLTKYDFIGLQEPDRLVTKWKTINFSEKITDPDEYLLDSNGNKTINIKYKTGELLDQPIYSIKITDMLPGSKFYINNELMYIGSTGAYMTKTTAPIYSLKLPDDAKYTGSAVVEYKDILHTRFDDIRAIDLVEYPVLQIVGNSYWQNIPEGIAASINIIDMLEDVKTEVIGVPIAKFAKRGIHKIYTPYTGEAITKDSIFYSNGNSISNEYKINLNELDKLSLFEIHYSAVNCDRIIDKDGVITYVKNEVEFLPNTNLYYEPQGNKILDKNNKDPNDSNNNKIQRLKLFEVKINNNYINLEDTEERVIKDFDYSYISIGDGIIADLTVITQVMEYSYEYKNEEVLRLKIKYEIEKDKYLKNVVNPSYDGDLDSDLIKVKQMYKEMTDALDKAIIEDYTQGG